MSYHFAEAEMIVPRFIGATSSHDHRSLIQPEDMARRSGTSVETAIITLEEAPTQRANHNSRRGLQGGLKHSNSSLITRSLQKSSTAILFFQESLPSGATLVLSCSALQMGMLRFIP
jgi:hypothetical protein